MDRFVGSFQHTLDVKARLILPAKYRSEFLAGGYIAPDRGGCVSLYTPEEFEKQAAKYIAMREDLDNGGLEASRFWSAGTSHVEVDRQGRFVVPANARAMAKLEGDILIVGQLNHMELWNPEIFQQRAEIPGAAVMGMSFA